MAARRQFRKWHIWKYIGPCPYPERKCIQNLKLKFQSKVELCSGNHIIYWWMDWWTDGQGESSITPPPTLLSGGITMHQANIQHFTILWQKCAHRNVETYAHFCYKMVHCQIWDWCIVEFVQLVYWFWCWLVGLQIFYAFFHWSFALTIPTCIDSTLVQTLAWSHWRPSH